MHMLNKYGQRSFYNMSGFGDISVLAALMTENEAPAGCCRVSLKT